MTEQMMELSRRTVACKHWRWMPGMLTTRLVRVASVLGSNDITGVGLTGAVERAAFADELPNLTCPATIGCLLALVREAWNDQTLSAHYIGWLSLWEMIPMDDNRRPLGQLCGSSEVESLVLALEAAP